MHFNLANMMILAALAASLFLIFRTGERIPAAVALVVSGLEALVAFRIVTFHGPPRLGLILAAALAGAGAWAWARAGSKTGVTAATVVTVIGVIQLLIALRLMA